jgi:hypothetical protein
LQFEQRASMPKSYVADVHRSQTLRGKLNRPSGAIFFWLFLLVAVGAVAFVVVTS